MNQQNLSMNKETEPSPSDSSKEKPNGLRLAFLSALALALFGRTLLANDHLEPSGAKQAYATAQGVLVEVQAELQRTPCRFADKAIAQTRLNELPALLPAWQQTARVEPSELLRSLQRIAEVASCHPNKASGPDELGAMKQSLEEQLAQDVRSLFARLRRAQREGDRKGAYRHVTELGELLRHHQGPYMQHLDLLERMYKEP
jgi:hypothetical protein